MVRSTDGLDKLCNVIKMRELIDFSEEHPYNKKTEKYLNPVINQGGYVTYRINDRYYMGHRLKYALYEGVIPDYIDHIDGDKTNNDLSNLRLCKQGLNVANARIRSDNTSGYIGVIWHKATLKWQAQTMFNGKRVHIGLFTDKKEAALAYNYKITELFGHNCTFNQVFEDV